ncbi:hypothetical protein RCL1_003882 [Eukaryota sp. TZLM3-RCL]
MTSNFSYLFKLVLVGDFGTGKSNLLLRFTENKFTEIHTLTVGVEFGARLVTVDDTPIKLQIWDTAGQESFRSITRSYYRNSAGAFLLFDLTRRETFLSLPTWIEDIKSHATTDLSIILIGNKSDQEDKRQTPYVEAQQFAEKHGLVYLETSARLGNNVDNAFMKLAKSILQKIENGEINVTNESSGVKAAFQIKSNVNVALNDSRSGCSC